MLVAYDHVVDRGKENYEIGLHFFDKERGGGGGGREVLIKYPYLLMLIKLCP